MTFGIHPIPSDTPCTDKFWSEMRASTKSPTEIAVASRDFAMMLERQLRYHRIKCADLEKRVSDYMWQTNPDRMGS